MGIVATALEHGFNHLCVRPGDPLETTPREDLPRMRASHWRLSPGTFELSSRCSASGS